MFLVIEFFLAITTYHFFKNNTTFEDFLLIFKIENSRNVENVFHKTISHNSLKSNYFQKLVKSDSKEKFY